MKHLRLIIIVLLATSVTLGCATTSRDLARTLRYTDGRPVAVGDIDFNELQSRNRGQSCTWNLLMTFPLLGDGSTISAADNGNVNNVEMIGETGTWFFPFNRHCTVVFGDGNFLSGSNNNDQQPRHSGPETNNDAAGEFWQ